MSPQFTRSAAVIAIAIAGAACVNSRPYQELAIDHAGFAGRLRRMCELARSKAGAGACATEETIEDPDASDSIATEEVPGASDGGSGESNDDGSGTSPDAFSQDAITSPP